MAIKDNAVLVVSTGRIYTAPVGTAAPTNLKTSPATPWDEIGHTSLEDILGVASEGGEATTLGTLQNKQLRVIYADRNETFALNLQQFDEAALKLYYGSNAQVVNGLLQVPNNPTPTQKAFLAIFQDADNVFAIYAPKVSIFRGDDVDLSDTESLASLPLTVTPLINGSNNWTYAVTPLAAAP